VTGRSMLRLAFVIFVVLMVQQTVMVAVRIDGYHPDLLWLLPITAALLDGPETGAIVGFWSGLAFDLTLPTPFGLSALVGCLLGYGTGLTVRGLVRSSWWLPPIVAAGATAVGLSMYAILGAVLGDPGALRTDLVPALVVATPGAVILATPVVRMVGWALPAAPASRGAHVGTGGR
jgi:rod shape-determining protein MreD